MRWRKHRIRVFEIEPINQTSHCLLNKGSYSCQERIVAFESGGGNLSIYCTRAGSLNLMLQYEVSKRCTGHAAYSIEILCAALCHPSLFHPSHLVSNTLHITIIF
jgi:hypothetical protein